MQGNISSGYRHAVAITPTDNVYLNPLPVNLWVGHGGQVAVFLENDTGPDGVDHTTSLVAGSGYHWATTTVTDSGGSPTRQATYGLDINPSTGAILAINVLDPGTGYSGVPSIIITDTAAVPGVGASAVAVLGAPVVIMGVPSGYLLPVRAKIVNSTNTTATEIIGLG